MSADTSDLSKVESPTDTKTKAKERKSSSYPGVFNINDLGTVL